MKPPIQHLVLNALSEAQALQLHLLYQREWWTARRSLTDVRTMLENSDFIFAIVAPDTKELLAFARVLTDRVFKALVLDVIVHPDHRSVHGLIFSPQSAPLQPDPEKILDNPPHFGSVRLA